MSAPILILKCGTTLPALKAVCGDYDAWFARGLTRPTMTCEVWSGARPPSVRDVAGIVVSGSPLSAAHPEPWMDDAAAYLRGAADAGVPILGVCFGHQLVGFAWGARVVRNPMGWELGTCDVRTTDAGRVDPLFRGIPATFGAHMSHRDIVVGTPDGMAVLAENGHTSIQAIGVGAHVRGVQFHPEADATMARLYISGRAAGLRGDGLDPDALEATVRQVAEPALILRNFERHFVEAG
ncbi:MAG: gamma-glutamyl-gamma-aminobutyrate hydrolase family protein [Myxococcota bacterium]